MMLPIIIEVNENQFPSLVIKTLYPSAFKNARHGISTYVALDQ